jgi:hypothetical protein
MNKIKVNSASLLLNKKRKLLLVEELTPSKKNLSPRVLTFQAEVMNLGFIFDENTLRHLLALDETKPNDFDSLVERTLAALRHMKGADVKHKPMYPNFPKQVMDASLCELYFNAIVRYITAGEWKPSYDIEPRLPRFEAVKFIPIEVGRFSDLQDVMNEILGSNSSVSDYDREVVIYLLKSNIYPQVDIPFKENLCWFVAQCLELGVDVEGIACLKTATDILRFVTSVSGGDITLAENTKFKSLPRKMRNLLLARLNEIANDDDIFRHRGKWIRLAHMLHVGEYSNRYPKIFNILSRARDGDYKHLSVDGKVELAINQNDVESASKILISRPGMFARRLDHLLRINKKKNRQVLDNFGEAVSKIDTRVLMQLSGHFKGRDKARTNRLVISKGPKAKPVLLKNELPALSLQAVSQTKGLISHTLIQRFENLSPLGKVYIDPALKECPIPLQLRDASEGLNVVARGTKFPLGNKDTLRLFIYWVGQDIDLTASLYSEDFVRTTDVSYYNLAAYGGLHSGDIVNAQFGASEFIDISKRKVMDAGYRYVVMSVRVFRGPKFKEHEVCYAGWMTREHANKNEIFDPKTVDQKIDVRSDSNVSYPVIFDLVENKAIWLDLATNARYPNYSAPNNAIMNRATTIDIMKGALDLSNKPTLYDLFELHGVSRGDKFVQNPEYADTVFSMDSGIKPTDTNKILSEFLM